MHHRSDTLPAADPAASQIDIPLDERSESPLEARLDVETQTVRSIEPRADAKAGTLLALCSALLVAGLALMATGRLHGAAAVGGWAAIALIGAAVLALTAALRPQLAGNFGFPRWARTQPEQILTELAAADRRGPAEKARQLHLLSRGLHTRFVRIQVAQTLLVAALAAAAAAALVSAWAR
ncbi:Pycsar system effector family protein [Paractinoplanes atraurantiacus]|uniref:Pycsar effector protein domain-containing protein n=1 Tax=Paractinoplanes atraurantiacus TaxID=1036182 RepID=A0A285KNR4_9ACTN|nr:Pycsar system effector family protein [Actinoplanes atraurantiacus]SNY72931.1 hypothetical protein SAMN05421748_14464 [Actinoplanes atraurantiacus]